MIEIALTGRKAEQVSAVRGGLNAEEFVERESGDARIHA
jgi:hypothetical protein